MYCTQCGKQPTKNKTNRGGNRTINPLTKICNECESNDGDTATGLGGAKRKDSISDGNANTCSEEQLDPFSTIPMDIVNKSGSDLSATDIYTIVTAAIQGTNSKIDELKEDVQKKIITLENRVKLLENENEKKDEDINILKHTVVSMQKAFNSIDQAERSTKAIIQHLPEKDMEGNEPDKKLKSDVEKIHQICKLMDYDLDIESIRNLEISRIGKEREGVSRMIKLVFANVKDRDAFVKNSSKLKGAPEIWSKIYIKKDQHPVYVAENNRLRKKMIDARKKPENKEKEIFIKDGKLQIDGVTIDQNLFFH